MRFGILGPLEVVDGDGQRCDPSAGRQRRMLLALLVNADDTLSVDQLVDNVWSEGEELPNNPSPPPGPSWSDGTPRWPRRLGCSNGPRC